MPRLGGVFPFPISSPATDGSPGAVMLQSGGVYLVPFGEFLVIPGQETVLEYWDQGAAQWRATQCYQGQVEQISSDGTNYRLVNLSGVIVGGSITNAGSGGTNGIGPVQTGSTVTFGASASGGATTNAQGYVVVGGTVAAPTVTQGGSGFLVPPLIAIDPPPPGGIQATAIATISAAGVITAITMVNAGAGYAVSPNFYVVPQPQFYSGAPRWPGSASTPGDTQFAQGLPASGIAPGLVHPNNVWPGSLYQQNISSALGALLTPVALTGSGTLSAIVMTYYGALYTGSQAGAISFGGTSLGAAAATPIFSFCCNVATGSSVTPAGPGVGYVVGNPAITSLGLVVTNSNNNLFTPRPIRGKVSSTAGVFTVEDPGFGIQSASSVGVGGGPNTTAGTVPAANLGGINDVTILQGRVQ